MVSYITFEEGGYLFEYVSKSHKPKSVVNYLKRKYGNKFIIIFKSGQVWDGFLGDWRQKHSSRKFEKQGYLWRKQWSNKK